MNRVNGLRSFYCLILRMHPAAFRERFGDEMLWIFDEDCRRGGAARLLADGVASLLRQRARGPGRMQPALAAFPLMEVGPGIAPRRFVEAMITASLLLAGFILLLSSGPRPLSLPACPPGAPRPARAARPVLQAPTRIEARPLAMPDRRVRSGPAQIDSAVASAVQIVREQESQGPPGAGFCIQK